jgi:hypothetical protein
MAIVPAGVVNQAELDKEIRRIFRKLGKDVVHATYRLGTDSTDDPAIFFRIVITDAASRENQLGEVVRQISNLLNHELRSYERWGLQSYFSLRSKSEQAQLKDPDWI